MLDPLIRQSLLAGIAIPAHPLALNEHRKLDERSQRALTRYYLASGVGGVAVGVHTTQFSIHDPSVGLYEPVLEIAAEQCGRYGKVDTVRVAGIIGKTDQAVSEAATAKRLGFHLGLLSLSAMKGASEDELIRHCEQVAEVIPVFGFYLQPTIGGLDLPYSFWRRFVEIPGVAAIKIAAFDRYKTFDVVRAVAEARREDIALYTGNDDNIVTDLVTDYSIVSEQQNVTRGFVGGLLGHWAVWTSRAVELLCECHHAKSEASQLPKMLVRNGEVTDCNAVLFDAANKFVGCIPGILEVLRRQGLVKTNLCLDESEKLSPGQASEIDRLYASYPHLMDDQFVQDNLPMWMSD